jgi:hypothetical protein
VGVGARGGQVGAATGGGQVSEGAEGKQVDIGARIVRWWVQERRIAVRYIMLY